MQVKKGHSLVIIVVFVTDVILPVHLGKVLLGHIIGVHLLGRVENFKVVPRHVVHPISLDIHWIVGIGLPLVDLIRVEWRPAVVGSGALFLRGLMLGLFLLGLLLRDHLP